MKTKFQFSRMDMTMLVINTVVFGGCLVLLRLGSASGPLILLAVGAFGMVVGKLGRAYFRARQSESSFRTKRILLRAGPVNSAILHPMSRVCAQEW